MALRLTTEQFSPVLRGAITQQDGRRMEYYSVELEHAASPRGAYVGVQHLEMPMLLESASGLPELAARSVLVAGPSAVFTRMWPCGLLDDIREWWSREAGEARGEVPAPGPGVYGMLAYEAARAIERLPLTTLDDVRTPIAHFGRYDAAAVWDHTTGGCRIWARTNSGKRHAALLMRPLVDAVLRPPMAPEAGSPGLPIVTTSHSWSAYRRMVLRAKAYIRAGDIFQANLAQRLRARWRSSAWALYDRLMRINPSPFSVLADFGDWQLVSCSPERLVCVEDDRIETRPIAGTRPRGTTPTEDALLQQELRVDPKECAEHIMIVDMARNDIGRVCEYGTVRPASLAHIESYSHVSHIVSSIVGRKRPDVDPWDILRAVFPGASITGVPKVRCMEIIDELERVRRGVYTGSFGWIAPTGACDWNILIRSFTLRDGFAYAHVGGGIVADSDPEREYQETWAKAGALLTALGADTAGRPQAACPTGLA